MSHFLLIYELSPEYLERRPQFREEHLALAWRAADEGALVLGGAVGNPIESALLLFTNGADAERFAAADPYVREGLVLHWRVSPWATVVGQCAATPIRLD